MPVALVNACFYYVNKTHLYKSSFLTKCLFKTTETSLGSEEKVLRSNPTPSLFMAKFVDVKINSHQINKLSGHGLIPD